MVLGSAVSPVTHAGYDDDYIDRVVLGSAVSPVTHAGYDDDYIDRVVLGSAVSPVTHAGYDDDYIEWYWGQQSVQSHMQVMMMTI